MNVKGKTRSRSTNTNKFILILVLQTVLATNNCSVILSCSVRPPARLDRPPSRPPARPPARPHHFQRLVIRLNCESLPINIRVKTLTTEYDCQHLSLDVSIATSQSLSDFDQMRSVCHSIAVQHRGHGLRRRLARVYRLLCRGSSR